MSVMPTATSARDGATPSESERIARCRDLRQAMLPIVGPERLFADRTTRLLHSYDASLERAHPDLVVRPRTTDELRALVAASYRCGVPFTMRGAGTGYSGGAVPARGGAVILTTDLDRVLDTNMEDGWIRCEPGVVLASVQQLAAAAGWRYLPDPSSYQVCTIGGNVAENAGGPHALAGGPTAHHVTGLDLIRPDGSITHLDEQQPWDGGLDLRALMIGSEGTLGAISSATLRLVRAPERERVVLASFGDQRDAVAAVADVFDSGLLPSALDMLTGGFIPADTAFADPSLLFVGLQGTREEVADQADRVGDCVRRRGGRPEVLDLPAFLPRRADFVRAKVRRMVAATGRPRYYLFDAVAPRSALPELMEVIKQAATEFELPVLNTFHAGDGNVHPTPFYDPGDAGHRNRLLRFSEEILRECHRLGGSLSGEHGIGSEKIDLMAELQPAGTLTIMRSVKDAFDPDHLSNPGKLVPPPGDGNGPVRPTGAVKSDTSARVRVHRADAVVEINTSGVTFADVEAALAGQPYELPYEPLGGTPAMPVLAAVDLGLPGLREPAPMRPRDLILGGELRQHSTGQPVSLGGRCAKDVAGYELRTLLYGARGRLGTLESVQLRLLPRPTASCLAETPAMDLVAAVSLCRRVRDAALPFLYLGVLVVGDAAVVTGRMELNGGSLDRHLGALGKITGRTAWSISTGSRWHDPAMRTLAGSQGVLTGTPSLSLDPSGLTVLLPRDRPAYLSLGHRRIWWRGADRQTPTSAGDALVDGVVSAFSVPPC